MDKKKGKLRRAMVQRTMGILLAAVMVFNTLPVSGFAVFASENMSAVEDTETGLCEYHTEEGSVSSSDAESWETENAGDTVSDTVPDSAKGTDIDTEKTESTEPEDTKLCAHHQEHTGDCGYGEESPCAYKCRICPIEDLIAALPDEVTEDNAKEVRAQLDEILDIYRELTEEEQEQLDLTLCYELQEELDEANAPVLLAEGEETLAELELFGLAVQNGDSGDGWSYEDNTLTLDNFHTDDSTEPFVHILNPPRDFTIYLKGENSVKTSGTLCYGNMRGCTTIIGEQDASLSLEGNNWNDNDIIIENAKVDITTRGMIYLAQGMRIDNAIVNVNMDGSTGYIYATFSGLTVENGSKVTITNRSGAACCVSADNGLLTVTDSTLSLNGTAAGVHCSQAAITNSQITGIIREFYNSADTPTQYQVYGQSALGADLTVVEGRSFMIPEDAALAIPAGVTLTNNGTMHVHDKNSLTGAGSLAGEGKFLIDVSEDMISGTESLTYTGTDYTDQIKLADTVTICGVKFTADTESWTRNIQPEVVKDAGEYTVTYTNGDKIISKTFTVAACPHTGLVYAPLADGKHGGTCTLCGTVVSEEHKWVDGTCSVCNAKAVAQVETSDGTTIYLGESDFAKAFDTYYNYNNVTVTLLSDIQPGSITMGETQARVHVFNTSTLDLAGHTITSSDTAIYVWPSGNLTIKDSSSGKTGQVVSTGSAAILTQTPMVSLTGGTYTGNPAIDGKNSSTNVSSLLVNYGSTNAADKHYAYYQGSQPVNLASLDDPAKLPGGPYTVAECNHDASVCEYQQLDGGTSHKKTCLACGMTWEMDCSFTWTGAIGKCGCGATLAVTVSDADKLTYDGNAKTPGVTVTLDGTTLDADKYTVAYDNNMNAGNDTASVTVSGTGWRYMGSFTIKPATPTIAWSDTSQEQTYTGNPAIITAPTVTLVNGETFGGAFNYSYAVSGSERYIPGLPTDAGTYTIKASVAEQGNYTAADSTNTLALTIGKAQGTLTVPGTPINKKFGDAEFSLNCSTNGDGKISYISSNENVASVSADGNVLIKGVGETIITVSLAEGTNHTGGAKATVTVTVKKADAPTVINEKRNYTYLRGSNGAVTIDVAGKLPKDRGETTYTFTTTDEKGILSGVSVDNDGNLIYTVLGNKSDGDTASITVTAEMANYENATYTVNIELVEKIVVEPQAGSSVSVKGSNILAYGQTLSDLALDSVIFVEQGTDIEVEGTLAWKDGSIVPAVGTAAAEWTFMPANAAEYVELTGMVAITVVKATPEVEAPTADTVTYHPSGTLGSVGLIGGSATWTVGGNTVTVKGTWTWKDASAVPSVGNSGYTAVFTPKDTANYNTAECAVVVPVAKAVPHIAAVPTAAQITYGDALDVSALTGGTAQYSDSDNTAVAGSFAWKDGTIKPAVSDSGSTEYTVVFTPADSTNYSSVEIEVTLIIEKAENVAWKPDTGKPFIKGEGGKEGWSVIREEVENTKDGGTVTVDMNGTAVVPGDVLNGIKGRNITIVFDMGNGIAWSVNGQSITADKVGDIDFSVKTGTNTIPAAVAGSVTGGRYSIQLSLAYDGEFGFTAVLFLNLGKENAGRIASLYYYNETAGEMEFISADEIAEDGTVELMFIHASDYVVVVGGEEESGNDAVFLKSPQTGQEDKIAWLIVADIIAFAGAGTALVWARRKKKEE